MSAPVPTGPSAPGGAPPLHDLIRQGEWRRALATARLSDADSDLQDALESVLAVQEHLRARRYAPARRAAAEYAALAGDAAAGELSVLRRTLPPAELTAALEVMEERPSDPEPAALAARLAPALALPLTRPEALNAQGVVAGLQGDEAGARRFLEEAVALDPAHYRAWTNLGNLDLEAGRFQAAEARYREVVALNPEYDVAHHNLGVALRRQGRVAESVRAIRTGQRLNIRRSREQDRQEVRAQLASTPATKYLRWIIVAALVLLLLALLRGGGG